MSAGHNPRTGRAFVCTHHNCKGGSGATEGYDGWNHTGPVSNMGGSRATDPEIFEMAWRLPVRMAIVRSICRRPNKNARGGRPRSENLREHDSNKSPPALLFQRGVVAMG